MSRPIRELESPSSRSSPRPPLARPFVLAGIWTKFIKTQTNLHQTVINKVLKALESKNEVKSVKSVKVRRLRPIPPRLRDRTGC